MKRIFLLIVLLTSSISSAGNETLVQDRETLEGGFEMLINGTPEVIFEHEHGFIYSGKTHITTFSDGSKRVRYFDGVALETFGGYVLFGDEAVEFEGSQLTFKGSIEIFGGLAKNITSFSCKKGIVYRDGQSTGQRRYVYRNVLVISCDRNDNIKVDIK